MTQRRRQVASDRYWDELAPWAKTNSVTLMPPPIGQERSPYHLFSILLPTNAIRDRFLNHCRQRGVLSVFHYLPLHRSRVAQRFGAPADSCPITDDVSSRLARLPLYSDMEPWELERVLEVVKSFGSF